MPDAYQLWLAQHDAATRARAVRHTRSDTPRVKITLREDPRWLR